MALNDTGNRGKSQTGPFADRFRREERIEDFFQDFRRNSDPRVADGNEKIRPWLSSGMQAGQVLVNLSILGPNAESSTIRHRVARVETEVEEELLDLCGIRLDRPQWIGAKRANLYTGRQALVKKTQHVFDDRDHMNLGVFALAAPWGPKTGFAV